MGAGVELDEQPAVGMPGQDVGTGDVGGGQQRMEVGDDVLGGPRRGGGVALSPWGVGGVIAAGAREGCDAVLDGRPVAGQPALEGDGGAARAGAVQKQLASADVKAARVVAGRLD